jgi:glyoxylase-like metal-dependent hydrolase (beta-lactamase superfamily II)
MEHNKLEAITDHIFLVQGKNKGRFPFSHSILILDEDIVLVDTGCGIENLKKLTKEYDVSYVINSHTHPDHSAGNWVFKHTPTCVPEEGFETSGDLVALSGRFVNKELAQEWQEFIRETMNFKNCRPTESYNSRTKFRFGKTTFEPIYTSGHTKDHYCFYEPRERILFSFDYDLTSFPWYGHRESSIPEFKDSLKKLEFLSPKIVVSSHRGMIAENIDAEFDKFYKIFSERDGKILSLLENGKTIDQLVEYAPIYGKFSYAESILRYWESEMVKKHLKEMETCGKIEKRGKIYMRRSP